MLFSAFLALCVVSALAMSHVNYGSKINPDSFKLIKNGMTKQHVEEILGGPPRDENTGEEIRLPISQLGYSHEGWRAKNVYIHVCLDWQNDAVVDSDIYLVDGLGFHPISKVTLLGRIRSWWPW
jgi:hypothetical protein